MTQVHDYHLALQKIMESPLELTERDLAILKAFNPRDEARGRDAIRAAQLALLPPAPTKAAHPPRPSGPTWRTLTSAFDMVGQALHHERDRVNVLEARVAALETLTREQTSTITKQASTIDEQAGTITDLRDEIKVVGQFAADTRQRAPSRVESRDTRH